MSDYIDTREGWTEVDVVTAEEAHEGHTLWEFRDGESVRAWVREAPVPPLPTAPYTTIRAQVSPDEPDVTLVYDGTTWLDIESGITARRLDRITSFVVLAEPRAVTAKAVIDRVTELVDAKDSVFTIGMYDTLAAEFGVGQ